MKRLGMALLMLLLLTTQPAPVAALTPLDSDTTPPPPVTGEIDLSGEPEGESEAPPDSDDEDENAADTARLTPVITEIQVSGACDPALTLPGCSGNNYEFIELYNPYPEMLQLDGLRLNYQGGGAVVTTIDLSGAMASASFLLVSHQYSGPLAVIDSQKNSFLTDSKGAVWIVVANNPDAVVDQVAWGSSPPNYYYAHPAPAPPTNQSVQRCLREGMLSQAPARNTADEFQLYPNELPTPGSLLACQDEVPLPGPGEVAVNTCDGIILTEIAANVVEQFIELYNSNAAEANLDGCRLQTNRSLTALHELSGRLHAGEYAVVYITDTALTLTKTTTGTVYLISSDGQAETDVQSYANLKTNTSWSRFDDGWRQSYKLTPGAVNVDQPFLPCEKGYLRNKTTGRCRKITPPQVPAECGQGRYRHPETGRCRKLTVNRSQLTPCRADQYRSAETHRCRSLFVSTGTLTPCKQNQYRNPDTNRCRSVATLASAPKPCADNQERNPATNRCRLKRTTLSKEPFAVAPIKETGKAFIGWWALGGLAFLAVGYAGWEWRQEVTSLISRVSKHFTARS